MYTQLNFYNKIISYQGSEVLGRFVMQWSTEKKNIHTQPALRTKIIFINFSAIKFGFRTTSHLLDLR
jgi:hypothetical protein